MMLDIRRSSPLEHLREFAISVRSQHRITRIVVRRSIAVVAVVGILLSPVQYRGGATFAHPHSLLHLFADAADGSGHHPHESGHHQVHDHPAEPSGGVSSPRPALETGTLHDGPRWTSATLVGGSGAMMVAIASLVVALSGHRAPRPLVISRRLVGLIFPPEPPPPRGVAGASLL